MNPKINLITPEGEHATIGGHKQEDPIFITDLGLVYLRVYYPEQEKWINHSIGRIEDLLPEGYTIQKETELV